MHNGEHWGLKRYLPHDFIVMKNSSSVKIDHEIDYLIQNCPCKGLKLIFFYAVSRGERPVRNDLYAVAVLY